MPPDAICSTTILQGANPVPSYPLEREGRDSRHAVSLWRSDRNRAGNEEMVAGDDSAIRAQAHGHKKWRLRGSPGFRNQCFPSFQWSNRLMEEFVMIAKCANGACSRVFDHLAGGLFFRFVRKT